MLLSRLNQRVSFWKKTSGGRNPDGSLKPPSWAQAFTAWAEVLTIGGEEGRLAAADSSTVKYRLTLRYRRDVDPSMYARLVDEGRFLTIQAIRDPDGQRNIVEITCEWKQGQVEPL